METLATFLATKLAEKPLFGESGEKFQEKQTEFASRIAENRRESPKWRSYLLDGVWYFVRSGAVPVENGESFA